MVWAETVFKVRVIYKTCSSKMLPSELSSSVWWFKILEIIALENPICTILLNRLEDSAVLPSSEHLNLWVSYTKKWKFSGAGEAWFNSEMVVLWNIKLENPAKSLMCSLCARSALLSAWKKTCTECSTKQSIILWRNGILLSLVKEKSVASTAL